jgi:hypothetical protein
MNYLRQTVNSDILASLFDLPAALRGIMVDVIVLPSEDLVKPSPKNDSSFGCLHKYADPLLMNEESGAWEKLMSDKYADH